MGPGSRIAGAAVAGVLCANSLPHLSTAAAGGRMLTPLAGRDSPAWVNALWGGANLVGGLLLARAVTGEGPKVTARREAFGLGVAAFSAWAVVGERIVRFNDPEPRPDE